MDRSGEPQAQAGGAGRARDSGEGPGTGVWRVELFQNDGSFYKHIIIKVQDCQLLGAWGGSF